jgi:hypothetical protein
MNRAWQSPIVRANCCNLRDYFGRSPELRSTAPFRARLSRAWRSHPEGDGRLSMTFWVSLILGFWSFEFVSYFATPDWDSSFGADFFFFADYHDKLFLGM